MGEARRQHPLKLVPLHGRRRAVGAGPRAVGAARAAAPDAETHPDVVGIEFDDLKWVVDASLDLGVGQVVEVKQEQLPERRRHPYSPVSLG